ncbi:hypothetical protein DFH06DRAFT_1309630 [Mycena polygramma]|nr:hypothetical protein DFH06DRAFT_1309630 [Mycena polygramma]
MGDTLCSGILYLCSCCCFCSSSDPGTDGSGFCTGRSSTSKRNRDPREKALKQEFMERGYHRDSASGRIHVDQPSQSQLMAAAVGYQSSAEHVEQHSEVHSTTQKTPAKELVAPNNPPGLNEPP